MKIIDLSKTHTCELWHKVLQFDTLSTVLSKMESFCELYGLSDKNLFTFLHFYVLYSLKGLWGEYQQFPQPAHVNHN